MRTLIAALLVTGAVGWGIYGGGPIDLPPGPRMAQQLSQLTR